MEPVAAPRGPLRDGERVLLLDAKDRRYLVTLRAGGTWHSHGGALALDPLIGAPEGTAVQSASGMAFTAFRPRLADVALKMPRGAQVVYPKDAAAIEKLMPSPLLNAFCATSTPGTLRASTSTCCGLTGSASRDMPDSVDATQLRAVAPPR